MENQDLAKARAHRARLGGVTFVGITGSCGKTTTKDLATSLLSRSFRGSGNPGSGNCGADLIRHVLSVEPDHRFCIQELGAWAPGTLDAGLELVRPDVGVVLNVRRDHYSGFRGLEHTRAEKMKVVACLPPTATAVLNADDPRVASMRERTKAKVVSFGAHPDADFRTTEVRSPWPERLSFDLTFEGERRRVRTQLIGEHLAGSAAAALAIAHSLGVSLDEAVERLAEVAPTARRMSPMAIDPGVSVIRDDFKAVSDSLEEILRFLESAHARRKLLVVGRISDHPGRSRPVYTSFARAAAQVADLLVFVGERPASLWGGRGRESSDFLGELSCDRARVEVFETVRDASRFVRGELRSGDLLVLKGSGASDHLERIALDPVTEVRCWRAHCGRVLACDACELLELPAEPGDPLPGEK